MSAPPRAWVLNLDAEHELAAGRRYAPTRALQAIVARERRRLLGTLVAPGDIVLDDVVLEDVVLEDVVLSQDEALDPERTRGLEGRAWSPTPRALARLAAAGAHVPAASPAIPRPTG